MTLFNETGNVAAGNEYAPIEKFMFNFNLMPNKEVNEESMLMTSETIKTPAFKTIQDILLFWCKGNPLWGLFLPCCSLDNNNYSGNLDLTRRLSFHNTIVNDHERLGGVTRNLRESHFVDVHKTMLFDDNTRVSISLNAFVAMLRKSLREDKRRNENAIVMFLIR